MTDKKNQMTDTDVDEQQEEKEGLRYNSGGEKRRGKWKE